MIDIRELYSSMAEPDRDMFVQVLQDFGFSGTQRRVSMLEKELSEVVVEIDLVNAQREFMTSEKEKLGRLLDVLSTTKDKGAEVLLLEQVFLSRYHDLCDMIVDMKPTDLLKKKHLLGRKIADARRLSEIAEAITGEVKADGVKC